MILNNKKSGFWSFTILIAFGRLGRVRIPYISRARAQYPIPHFQKRGFPQGPARVVVTGAGFPDTA